MIKKELQGKLESEFPGKDLRRPNFTSQPDTQHRNNNPKEKKKKRKPEKVYGHL